jgi:hypothetical protein
MALNKELLDILACNKVYPIREEIPVMLVDEAIGLEDWQAGKRNA